MISDVDTNSQKIVKYSLQFGEKSVSATMKGKIILLILQIVQNDRIGAAQIM